VISATVLVFVFSFIADILRELTGTNERAKVLSDLYEFNSQVNNYKSAFLSGSMVVDNAATTGFDVFMFKNTTGTDGILIGVVDLNTKKLAQNSIFSVYGKNVLALRTLTTQNITDINTSSVIVNTYTFNDDKIYKSLYVKDFQVTSYNLATIWDVFMTLVIKYSPEFNAQSWINVPQDVKDNLFQLSLNF
jgi:hypothetical protein